jgi:hypothetical protein
MYVQINDDDDDDDDDDVDEDGDDDNLTAIIVMHVRLCFRCHRFRLWNCIQ